MILAPTLSCRPPAPRPPPPIPRPATDVAAVSFSASLAAEAPTLSRVEGKSGSDAVARAAGELVFAGWT